MTSEIKRRFTDTEMQTARETDLPELLTHLGYQVKRIGRYYTTAEMDSLRIKDRRTWFRYSQGIGGDAITFLQHFCNQSFPEAVEYLLTFQGRPRDAPVKTKPVTKQDKPSKEFALPPRNADDRRVFAYLRKRGIAAQVIRQFMNSGSLYEDAVHHNCVFVGRDHTGQARYAGLRGTYDRDGKGFRGDVSGSDKDIGFAIPCDPVSDQVRVFEAPIDLMSYYTLHRSCCNAVALCGLYDGALRTYCRVSSDSKDQLHSYAAQIRSYTEEIAQHDGWELVDVYADEGLTGTRMDQRDDFNRMMRDCRKGKIDRILVKSVSRFARNTRDCLSALRELSAMGVSVRFEKENIDTKTLTTELMVSVSGSLAQQESISISANQKMSYQRRMERGEFITCTAPYGYRIMDKKDLEIVPEEAATVRWIFDAYLKGRSSGWIAEQLTAKGIPSQSGAECWRETGIRYLLTNEKYIGDALSQKSYSCGFPFVQKRNHGERLQYYTENSHPAIIDRDTFERVQALLQKKAQKEKKRREKSPLALKIVCGNCGTVFQRRSSQNGYVTWVCRTHDRHAADCPVGRIPEAEIHAAFLRMYHRLKSNADIILAPALRQLNTLDTILRQNHPQVLAINRAIAEATEESHKISTLRANGLLDADICAARMNAISARLAQLRGERRRLSENEALDETMDAIRKMTDVIKNGPEQMNIFDEDLFDSLVEKVIAESQTRIRFRLYGGLELAEQLEVAAR